jgi:hypothetical protein
MEEDLVALVRDDANELLRMLPSVGKQEVGRTRQVSTIIMLGRTTSSGLSTTSEGDVRVHTPTASGWAASSPAEIVKAWAWPTVIVGEKYVMLFEVNGRLVAQEVGCEI